MNSNKKSNTSILPDHHPQFPEIFGSYWPRIVHRNEPMKCGKKVERKDIKTALRRRYKAERYQSETVMQSALCTPVFDLSCPPTADVPCHVEDRTPKSTQPHFSPVTGRPLTTLGSKGSRLVPLKPLRKQQRSRGRSDSHSAPTVAKD